MRVPALAAFESLREPYQVAVDAAAAVDLSGSGNVHRLRLKAICTATHVVYIGDEDVTAATGYPLFNGDELDLDVRNGATVYAIADADGQKVAVLPSVIGAK